MTEPAQPVSGPPMMPPLVVNAAQIFTGRGQLPDGTPCAVINLANPVATATANLPADLLDQVIASLQQIRTQIAGAELVIARDVPMRAHQAELAARAERANGAGRGY